MARTKAFVKAQRAALQETAASGLPPPPWAIDRALWATTAEAIRKASVFPAETTAERRIAVTEALAERIPKQCPLPETPVNDDRLQNDTTPGRRVRT